MPVSVATLIDQAKLHSDKRSDASIADADWLIWINWSVESLWRVLTNIDPELFFAQGDFTLAGGSAGATKDLSTVTGLTRFRALHGLDINPDQSTRMTVARRNFRERNNAAVGWWLPATLAPDRKYDLRGRTVVITPYESAAGSYRAYARLGPYLFASGVDVTALDWELEQYHEYIPVRAAMKALGQEESDETALARQLGSIVAEATTAHRRDDNEPAVIADVEGETAGM